VLKFSKKGSKLIVIFIITVIFSGSILTYLSVVHISNYKELLEKKISEEERDLTIRFTSDFQDKMESLISIFSNFFKSDHSQDVQALKSFERLNELINYVAIDSSGSFLWPYVVNNDLSFEQIKPSNTYSNALRTAQKNEFISKDLKNAESYYLKSLKVAETKSDSANCYNSLARLYVKMGHNQKAFEINKTIITKFNNALNPNGFPYVYFSIIKILKINDPSNFQQLENLILIFLNGLKAGTTPLNESSVELLDAISEWKIKYPDSSDNDQFEKLITQNKNSLLLVQNYRIPIEKIIKDEFTEAYHVNFSTIKPISGSTDEMMLFFSDLPLSVGFVIGLKPIFINVLEDQKFNNLKFDYNIELIKKRENKPILNNSLVELTEFSPYFEDYLIQVSLKNENIIDQAVFRRKITYGIGLFLFLGTMALGLYLLIQDVNREKRMNKLKANFVSNVTHELKTPLTSINMFAEALNMGKDSLDSRQIKYLNIIVKESEKLKRIINNILEFSKNENDKLSYKLEKSNLTEIVESTLKEMNYFLEINKFEVELAIEHNIFANVYGEGIKQALSNLISNAVKYSASNKKLIIRLFQSASNVFIEVEDFGIGMSQEELDLIFEKFYRINSDENETVSGTGLGLTVTKAIIEEQNGKLMVESTFGKGSKFIIELNSA
jgi:signal transduction histidine kinase